jgi:TRAP-type C4-dicarboxylate transport system permease small subunit
MSEGRLEKANRRATQWLAWGAAVCLFAMMLLTFVDVSGRFIRHPVLGATEVTAILMGFLVMFPLGYVTQTRQHLRADFIYSRLSQKTRDIFDAFTTSIALFVAVMISIRLFYIEEGFRHSGRYTQSLGIQLWPDALVMALASLLLVSSLALQIVDVARRLANGAPDEAASGPLG